jgi:hypothetical protein
MALTLDPSATGFVVTGTASLVVAQGALMLIDEQLFHRRRGLGGFERWGHPVDTTVFLAAAALPALAPRSASLAAAYAALAAFSTLLVTKDELIHARACGPAEHWVHAVLFALHGPILIGLGILWAVEAGHAVRLAVPLAALAVLAVQVTRWIIPRRGRS